MANSPGASTTAATLTLRTGSISSRGSISSSDTNLRLDESDLDGAGGRRIVIRASSGRPARSPQRPELDGRAPAVAGKSQAGPHRHLLRGRLDRAPVGRDGLSRAARELEPEFLRLECR